jgi:hypothetical protein
LLRNAYHDAGLLFLRNIGKAQGHDGILKFDVANCHWSESALRQTAAGTMSFHHVFFFEIRAS